eukprot:5096892-Lingulodinium_polyedra.AAC.1
MDQNQRQWRVARCLASQFTCWCRGDVYHRFWNDYKRALRWPCGWMHHSTRQLCRAFNVNYGPLP